MHEEADLVRRKKKKRKKRKKKKLDEWFDWECKVGKRNVRRLLKKYRHSLFAHDRSDFLIIILIII